MTLEWQKIDRSLTNKKIPPLFSRAELRLPRHTNYITLQTPHDKSLFYGQNVLAVCTFLQSKHLKIPRWRYSVFFKANIQFQGAGPVVNRTLNSRHFILFKLILILREMLQAALLQRTTEMFTLMIFTGKETDQKLSCFIFVIKLSKFVTIYSNKKTFVRENSRVEC